MVNIFTLFHGEGKGIFRSMFRSHNYWKLFEVNSSNTNPDYKPQLAFDFDTNKYWIPKDSNETTFLSFCFLHFKVQLEGYELTSSLATAHPNTWAFSGSNNGYEWEEKEQHIHPMKTNETYFVSWEKPMAYRCFKLDCINSTLQTHLHRFDLRFFDVYGRVIFFPITCQGNIIFSLSFQSLLLHFLYTIVS